MKGVKLKGVKLKGVKLKVVKFGRFNGYVKLLAWFITGMGLFLMSYALIHSSCKAILTRGV